MISARSSSVKYKAVLPSFGALILAGFSAVALILAFLLLLGHLWMGVSLISGFGLAMLVYGFLYQIVNRGFSMPASVQTKRKNLPANFGILMIGKLFIVGTAVAVLMCILHVAALWMLAGFFVTQIGVTSAVMRYLTNTKVTD